MRKRIQTIRGKRIVGGKAAGQAVVSNSSLCFRSEFNPVTGEVIDSGHPLHGRTLTNKILVIPSTKGSSGNPMFVRIAALEGKSPLVMINTEIEPLIVLACIVNHIPLMQIDKKDFDIIQDGTWIEVDTESEIVGIYAGAG